MANTFTVLPNQKQTFTFSSLNQQSLEVLKMSQGELLQFLSKIQQKNPLLHTKFTNFHGNEEVVNSYAKTPSLKDELYYQLHTYQKAYDENIASFIIESLNEHGFLSYSIEEYCNLLQENYDVVDFHIHLLQQFEPYGVCASNHEQSLLLQCAHDKNLDAVHILTHYKEEIIENNFKKIASKERITVDKVYEILQSIRKYNPYPCEKYRTNTSDVILPEVEVLIQEEDIQILPLRHASVKLYESDIHEIKQIPILMKYLKEANIIIDTLNRRNATLLMIMNELSKIQRNYFLFQSELVPCTMNELADILGLHVSTISRTLSDKYFLFHEECFPLKSLLVTSTSTGDSVDSIKKGLRHIITNEDKRKPYTDQQIVIKLKSMDLHVSRRTISKYREQLHIPGSLLRKQL